MPGANPSKCKRLHIAVHLVSKINLQEGKVNTFYSVQKMGAAPA